MENKESQKEVLCKDVNTETSPKEPNKEPLQKDANIEATNKESNKEAVAKDVKSEVTNKETEREPLPKEILEVIDTILPSMGKPNDGSISLNEVKNFFTELGLTNEKAVGEIFNHLDAKKDGVIKKDDIEELVQKGIKFIKDL